MAINVTIDATIAEFVSPSTTGYPAGLSISPVIPGAGNPRTLSMFEKVGLVGNICGGLETTSVSHMNAAINM
jgi:hypothetical protein